MTTPSTPAAPTPPPVSVSVRSAIPGSLILAGVAFAFLAGLALGWRIYHPKPGPVETPAAAVRQSDSSLVLPRTATIPSTKPGMIVPKGGTVERVVQVMTQVQPETTVVHDTVSSATTSGLLASSSDSVTITCPPDTVDLALIRLPDQTQRVIAKSRNGTLLGGVDIPVTNTAMPRDLLWSAGAIYDGGSRSYGGAVTREVGPFRALVAATPKTAIVGLAIRF